MKSVFLFSFLMRALASADQIVVPAQTMGFLAPSIEHYGGIDGEITREKLPKTGAINQFI